MPLYTYLCRCGYETDEFRHMDQRNDAPIHCGKPMERQITPHRVNADIQPYQSMATGEWITSRVKHREHLKRHKLIEVGNEVKYMTSHKKVKPDRRKSKQAIAEAIRKVRK